MNNYIIYFYDQIEDIYKEQQLEAHNIYTALNDFRLRGYIGADVIEISKVIDE